MYLDSLLSCHLVSFVGRQAGAAYLDALDAEAEGGGGTHVVSELHVARFENGRLPPFLIRGGLRVDAHHLLVQVLPYTYHSLRSQSEVTRS